MSPYSTLVKVFRAVETEGWDTARLSWLHAQGILKSFAPKESLFGSIDEQVFQFLKREQHYTYEIVCSRSECRNKKCKYASTELCLL